MNPLFLLIPWLVSQPAKTPEPYLFDTAAMTKPEVYVFNTRELKPTPSMWQTIGHEDRSFTFESYQDGKLQVSLYQKVGGTNDGFFAATNFYIETLVRPIFTQWSNGFWRIEFKP